MSTKSIGESLFGRIRRELLILFFMNPGRSFFLLEIVDILRTGRGGVQRELANLVESGIITREKSGMKVLFSLSANCPLIVEIRNLLAEFVNYEDMISLAVSDYEDLIHTAILSSAKVGKSSGSVKLLVSADGDSAEFRREIERIEVLSGIRIELFTTVPSELREFVGSSPGMQWILDGAGKLLAGTAEDFKTEKVQDENTISEPDLFSGTGFSW